MQWAHTTNVGLGPGVSIRRRGPQERLAAPPHDRFVPMLYDFCFAANIGCQEVIKSLQHGLRLGPRLLAASGEVVRACSKNERLGHSDPSGSCTWIANIPLLL